MAAIKGQNLRLLMDGRCVAASTNCNLHITAQTQENSTKDDTGEWAHYGIVGNNWDASVDALITSDFAIESGKETCDIEMGSIDTHPVYGFKTQAIEVPVGYEILAVLGSEDQNQKVYICQFPPPVSNSSLKASGKGRVSFVNPDAAPLQANIVVDYENTEVTWFLKHSNETNISDIEIGKKVTARFSITNGSQNRNESDKLVEGEAIITDINLNASNREDATYTCQLTGTSSLEFVDD